MLRHGCDGTGQGKHRRHRHSGPGTLYNLLEQFLEASYIRETEVTGRRRSYVLTPAGVKALEEERARLERRIAHFDAAFKED